MITLHDMTIAFAIILASAVLCTIVLAAAYRQRRNRTKAPTKTFIAYDQDYLVEQFRSEAAWNMRQPDPDVIDLEPDESGKTWSAK